MTTNPQPELLHLEDDETFPNNRLPVLLWRNGIQVQGENNGPDIIERHFLDNGWQGSWQDGIFTYHHYHSTAHEVLGIGRGSVRVMLGGSSGQELDLETGDIVLLPAGTAHRNLGASDDLIVVGAYPPGQRPDILRGEPGDRPGADQNIANVTLPDTDPVTGNDGPPETWRKVRS